MPKAFPVVETDAVHVLTVERSLSDQSAVVNELAALLPQVEDVLAGPPMALRLGFPRDGVSVYDLAFPIAEPVEREGFVIKKLSAHPAFSIKHEGPLADGPDGTNLSDTFGEFVAFIRETGVMVGDDPVRFIYHDGLKTVGTENEQFTLEIQYAYHTPMWLDAFRSGVSECLDADAAERVLAGSEVLEGIPDMSKATEWVHDAVARLDTELPDERKRACVLNGCAHHYIVESANRMKEIWDASGHDLRRHMELLAESPYFGAEYRLDESGETPVIFVTRVPANREGWEKATDPVEKRYHACFCPLVREAIKEQKAVSRTFCHCSGGWYVQEWEVVFGQKPEVGLVELVLEQADSCTFTIRVPEGFL